ncbi:MAG: GNAT family N-acetyltransferase [Sphingobium sp.]|jgi:acetyltransferase|nr:MAG: GNAT family N-acetyltransferase [Sphingobium sp.]
MTVTTDIQLRPAQTDSVRLQTRSGTAIIVRPATPDDMPVLSAFFDAVSDDDRRFRFLTAVTHVNDEQLRPMVDVDHRQTDHFLAFDEAGVLAASAMLACDAAMERAEVAISVRADHRGQGIGWTLLDHVRGVAKARGVRVLQSIENRQNRAAIGLEQEMGFTARPCEGDPALVILEARF